MATPGQLQLVGQELQVRLADNNWARIGSTVEVTTPPGPQILFPTGVKAKWKIVDIIVTAPLNIWVTGGPLTNIVNAQTQSVKYLSLVNF